MLTKQSTCTIGTTNLLYNKLLILNRTLYLLLLHLLLLAFIEKSFAIEESDPFLQLPIDLPTSFYPDLHAQPVLDMITGRVRFIPRLDLSRIYNNSPNAYAMMQDTLRRLNPDWKMASLPLISTTGSVCYCEDQILENEFLISEKAIKNLAGSFISINDESYKAILELIDYPFSTIELTSVALSELAYVYNRDALEIFLHRKNFDLLLDRGFLNSSTTPVYRDTQFLVAQSRDSQQVFIAIRGTSGAKDIELSLDASTTPWGKSGKVHRGYSDIGKYILAEMADLPLNVLGSDERPIILTGHSMGGSISLLVTLALLDRDIKVRALHYAPVPVGDISFLHYYSDIDPSVITNLFLPDEEVDISHRSDLDRWLYLVGTYKKMRGVGKTAGATHYVINYLKSELANSGGSVSAYDDSIPYCVLKKIPCFEGNRDVLVPACSLTSDKCFENAAPYIKGYTGERSLSQLVALSRQNKYKLIRQTHSPAMEILLLSRIAFLNLSSNQYNEGLGFAAAAGVPLNDNTAQGFTGIIRALIENTAGNNLLHP